MALARDIRGAQGPFVLLAEVKYVYMVLFLPLPASCCRQWHWVCEVVSVFTVPMVPVSVVASCVV